MTPVTLPQAQAIAEKQYHFMTKRKKSGANFARRTDWITTRANMILENGADPHEMKLLDGGI